MHWTKRGLIYAPDGRADWARHSALQPTPLVLDDEVIRVFIGCRDADGAGSVTFVDVAAENPSVVLRVAERPSLQPGKPGRFDEHGTIPAAAVRRDGKLYLYYAGYQRQREVRFRVFTGLAVSSDLGESFERASQVPVLDRTDQSLLFRVIHSILFEGDRWHVWYGAGDRFDAGPARRPIYEVRHTTSPDGVTFGDDGPICVAIEGPDEHRIGRPYVVRRDGGYRMFYGVGTRSMGYRLGYAEAADGHGWTRKDDRIGITVSASGWDSEMIGYPSVVETHGHTYLFYNGNRYGETGFGYAVLSAW